MPVTATFQPSHVSAPPGVAAALTLHLHNDDESEHVVRLKAQGDLADHTVLQSETIKLSAGESFDVPIIVDVGPALKAGIHTSGIEIAVGEGDLETETLTAEATIDVVESASFAATLAPSTSRSATAGRHRIAIDNDGNVPIVVELTAMSDSEAATVELAAPVLDVEPGRSAKVELRVHPRTRFWNGDTEEHPFTVLVSGNGETRELAGSWVQGPRIRPWYLPALVGMFGALLVGTLAWFALLKPWIEDHAEDTAVAVNEADQERLDAKIAELDEAAAQARQLPLGTPANLRFDAEAPPGGTATESFTVASDRVLSATDVVFQNPDGAVGRIALLRSGEVLLESQLANFRDLDFHFVAPFRFGGSDTVEIRLECETPGPTATNCVIGASVLGFVDTER